VCQVETIDRHYFILTDFIFTVTVSGEIEDYPKRLGITFKSIAQLRARQLVQLIFTDVAEGWMTNVMKEPSGRDDIAIDAACGSYACPVPIFVLQVLN
jgi:hypothetical protein